MRCPVLTYAGHCLPTRVLCCVRYWNRVCCDAVSRTGIGRLAVCCTDLAYAAMPRFKLMVIDAVTVMIRGTSLPIHLRSPYAMSGTFIVYGHSVQDCTILTPYTRSHGVWYGHS
eukprot:1301341-Rhodomonas_salina.4